MLDKIWIRNSGSNSELATSIPIKALSPFPYVIIYSLALPDLVPGDVIEAHAEWEVTNDYDKNIMSGRHLVLSPDATVATWTGISEAATENVTPANHHQHVTTSGTIVVTEPMCGYYVHACAFAAASTPGSTWKLIVEQDYGSMFVKVYPACMVDSGFTPPPP